MSDKLRTSFNHSSPDWNALARFIAGEGSVEERAAFARSLEENPPSAALVEELARLTAPIEAVPPGSQEIESALVAVRARASHEPAAPARRPSVVSLDAYRRSPRYSRLAIAAGLLVVVGAGVVWKASMRSGNESIAAAQKEYATAAGAMDSLTLPDGSRVLLGPGSHLTLAPNFGERSREMSLTGEAQFSVVHDSAREFVIHTPSATVRDVGTVFTVHSDAAEGARVVVTQGSVEVQEKGGSAAQTLGAGDVAVVGTSGGIQVRRAAGDSTDMAWTQGRLVFRDATVTEVAADLRRWYGVDVKVDSALARRPVTANFDRGISAADVIKIIAATIGGVVRDEAGVLHIVSVPTRSPVK